ncbi:polysaccharide deacetylase family protein [Crocinitomix catalasitica]|uniref:polysaccharide deacetylase family protein n=1 Tax=Crocinitomix catalasitica TaxID=184607 RepID=UPI000487B203|nr:polysaccharide deacetylase family protein [Crocinitomix catalasitica]
MINVFSEHHSKRLNYVLDFCFKRKGEEYNVVSNELEWHKLKRHDLNYSSKSLPAKLQINPQGILFEEGIYANKIITKETGGIAIDGVTDHLGVIFFLLTRYEEHFETERDHHDRFLSKNNALVKLNLHRQPVVDILVKGFWEQLELDYAPIASKFEGVPSFDIDVAWAYKNRSFFRTIGGFAKGKNIVERLAVLTGTKKDPYDTYAEINLVATKVHRIICFTLLGDWAKYDKNIKWTNSNYGSLIRGLNSIGGMGIHPSYASYLDARKIKNEIKRLEEIVGHEVVKSRQHFLKIKFPETYDILVENGIKRDFSMGFTDEVGFRAGTSFPFRYFNLAKNKKTALSIFPFAYMDNSFKDYLEFTPGEAKNEINRLTNEIKAVGGLFMFIWHNSSITNIDEWEGWKDVLDHTMNLIKVDNIDKDEMYEI